MKLPIKLPMIPSAFTEIISIVIGVLLALAVNEWNEDRVHTARANEAIQNVIHEINSNIKFLSFVNANNKAIIELINNKSDTEEDEDKKQFVPGLQIQDTAWKMMHSTNVSEFIDYQTLYDLSTIYSLQDIYKTLGYQLVQSITDYRVLVFANALDTPKGINNDLFLGDMMLIVDVENALLSSYTEILEKLKNR